MGTYLPNTPVEHGFKHDNIELRQEYSNKSQEWYNASDSVLPSFYLKLVLSRNIICKQVFCTDLLWGLLPLYLLFEKYLNDICYLALTKFSNRSGIFFKDTGSL